ncbi:MAG: hypothetical protein V4850_16390 [Myxococcota bacterium]
MPPLPVTQPPTRLNAALEDAGRSIHHAVGVSHAALDAVHVSHLLAGRLAARAYGLDCAVADVSYVVFPGAHIVRAGMVYLRPGVPVAVGTVPISYLRIGSDFSASILLEEPAIGAMPPVLPLGYLVVTMLRPGPHQDIAAVRGLLSNGADAARIRPLVEGVAPDLLGKFDRLVGAPR